MGFKARRDDAECVTGALLRAECADAKEERRSVGEDQNETVSPFSVCFLCAPMSRSSHVETRRVVLLFSDSGTTDEEGWNAAPESVDDGSDLGSDRDGRMEANSWRRVGSV